jgi:hypothetical protein
VRHVAERATGGVPRIRLGHPVRDTLLGLEIEVCPDLALDVVVSSFFMFMVVSAGQLDPKPPRRAGLLPPHTGLSTRAMARTSSSHRLCSIVSCFRPLAVSRWMRISRPRSVCSQFEVMQPVFCRRCCAG